MHRVSFHSHKRELGQARQWGGLWPPGEAGVAALPPLTLTQPTLSVICSGDSKTKLLERLRCVAIRGWKCSAIEIILIQGVSSPPSFILAFLSFPGSVTPLTSVWCRRGKQVRREPKSRWGYSCARVCTGSDHRGIWRMWVTQRRIRKSLFPFEHLCKAGLFS